MRAKDEREVKIVPEDYLDSVKIGNDESASYSRDITRPNVISSYCPLERAERFREKDFRKRERGEERDSSQHLVAR